MERLTCDRMFVAVLDAGSFSGAARRLGTGSAQASKLVSRLEAELGVQLIKRTTRALAPTEAGQAYYDRLKPLLEEYEALDAAVRAPPHQPAGRVRLTAPASFGTVQLTPALLAFACAYPGVQLDVSFSDRVANLVDEGFDAAVRIGHLADSSLVARLLCRARLVVVAAPSYLQQANQPQAPSDLAAHACILDTNLRDPAVWRFGAGAAPVTVSGRMRFSSGEACLAAAEAGLGVARLPSFIAGPSIRAGRVRLLLAGMEAPPLGVHAVYPPARHLAPKVRALVAFLADRFRGEPDWDRGW